jgi:hypothetical protein
MEQAMPRSSGEVRIEVNGEEFAGTYKLGRGLITVTYMGVDAVPTERTTQLGNSAAAPGAVARRLLSEIVADVLERRK